MSSDSDVVEVTDLAKTESIESGTTSTNMSAEHDTSAKKEISSLESKYIPISTDMSAERGASAKKEISSVGSKVHIPIPMCNFIIEDEPFEFDFISKHSANSVECDSCLNVKNNEDCVQIEGGSDISKAITISKDSISPANCERNYFLLNEVDGDIFSFDFEEPQTLKENDTSSKECDLHLTVETNALHIDLGEPQTLKENDTSFKECDLHLTVETNALHIAPNTSSRRKANTSKDRMKEKSFLPYFSVDRSHYSGYTDGVKPERPCYSGYTDGVKPERPCYSGYTDGIKPERPCYSGYTDGVKTERPCYSGYSDGIKTHSSSESENFSDGPETVSLNEELSSRVTMFEEIAYETIGDLMKNAEQKENYEGKKSSDEDIIILDVIPSPFPVQNRYSLPTSNKGFCKPHLVFSSEVGVKKSKVSTESTGTRRELWKQELKDKINEKKEANFIRKQQLQLIDNEDCVLIEASDADKKFPDGRISEKERERIKNLPFALGKPVDSESPIESDNCDDYDADGDNEYESDTTRDEDEDEDEDQDEDDSESSGFKPTSPDSKHSNTNSPLKFKNVPAHIKYLSPDMAYGKKHIETGTVQDTEVSNINDPLRLDTEAICFSLPSYQPCGGFANLKEEETNASDVIEDSPPSCSAVSAFGVGNEEIREEDPSIPLITITSSSDSDQKKAESHLKIEKPSTEHHNNFMSLCETIADTDLFDDSGVSQMCSGAFPSTSKSDLPNSVSSNYHHSEGDEDKTSTQVWSKDSDRKVTEDADVTFMKAKIGTKRKRAIIESDDETEDHVPLKLPLNFDYEVAQRSRNKDFPRNEELCEEEVTDSCLEEVYADKDNLIRGFIDDEAELSGEELSSDEEDEDVAEKDYDEDIPIPESSEVLRNQIGLLHFKQMENDDVQLLNKIKNDFLAEGDLYTESGELRRKKFSWSNKDLGIETSVNTSVNVSDSEDEVQDLQDQQDKLKWKKVNLEGDVPNEPADASSSTSGTRKFKVINQTTMRHTDATSSVQRKRGSILNKSNLFPEKKSKMVTISGSPRSFAAKPETELKK